MPLSEDAVDEVTQRVALTALMYYPEVHADDPAYDLQAEVTSCLEPAAPELPAESADELRDLVARTIIDPSMYREALTGTLLDLMEAD